MPTTTFLSNAYVTIAGVDVSDQCSSAVISNGFDNLEVSALGGSGHFFVKGLTNCEVTLTMFNSYGAGEVEATLASVVGTGTTTITISPASGAASTTNPRYTISNAMLATFSPITSTVGEISMVDVTFTGGTVVRAIA